MDCATRTSNTPAVLTTSAFRGGLVIAVVIGLAVPAAAATKGPKPGEPAIAVVAHVPLPADSAGEIFAREGAKNHVFLYVVHDEGKIISVVDVTNPSRATLVRRIDRDEPAFSGRTVDIGANTLVVESGGAPERPAVGLKTVRLLDLSDPSAPHVALEFKSVSTYIVDASRSLIYLVNNEGLWIIRHVEPMDWKTKAWLEFASTP